MNISIITTTYNRKALLEETIESVQRSIVLPSSIEWDHIIYDDGSTDGTSELFMANPWPHVTYARGTGNSGPSHGKNEAIARAQGEYILILDSDDILLERTLYYFFNATQENPDKDWFLSDFLHVDQELRYIPGDYYGWDFAGTQEMLEAIFRGEHFIQGNALFKKSLFTDVGAFDETLRIGEDLDLYVRFLLKDSLPMHVRFASHLHRFHTANLSQGITFEKHKLTAESLRNKYTKAK